MSLSAAGATRSAVAVLAVLVGGAAPALAGDGGGWDYAGPPDYCRDASRACVLEAADSYLVAVRNHDGDYARLAPMVKRTRNAGEQTPETQWYTRDEMADSLDVSEDPVTAVHSIDWVIDGDEAIAFYAIDASYEERGHQAAQTWLAERFHVTDGEIDEIEAIFFFAPGVGSTPRGWTTTPPSPAGREAVLAAAQRTFDAQRSGAAGDSGLADDVRRTLNGKETGRTPSVVDAVTVPFGPTVQGVRDVRWYADATTGDAVVFAALDHGTPAQHTTTLLLAQRLRVRDGLVAEIEQITWPLPGTSPAPTGWEDET